MRLAFCFMSNNSKNLEDLNSRFNYSMTTPPYIIDSFTKNVLINPPLQRYRILPDWNVEWKCYNSLRTHTDFFSLRQDSLAMAGNADYIYVGDDDFLFDGASFAINQCCVHMEKNSDCGAIYLGDNWGEEGKLHGDEIYITNTGHLNTNRGIIVRNRPVLMDNRLHALGACEDWIIGLTCLTQGYYVARRLHVPIKHLVERNTLKQNHENPNYDIDFIKHRGIFSKIQVMIGGFDDYNVWPTGIWGIYRQAAMRQGFFILKYDLDGTITGE